MVAEAHFLAIQTGEYYAWVSSGMLEVKSYLLSDYHVSISLNVGLAHPDCTVILQVENVADWPARNECGGHAACDDSDCAYGVSWVPFGSLLRLSGAYLP